MTAAIAATAALALTAPVNANANPPAATGSIVWNGASDKAVAATIDATASARTNASGPKITSNAHSDDFPGVYFIWDSKQKDNGYLKVDAGLFGVYDSFTLTIKESNTYSDILIAPQDGQKLTDDNCYVFFVPKVVGDKNINMVFVSDFVEHTNYPTLSIGFIGYYVNSDTGAIQTTSIFWQFLTKPNECVDWGAVDAAYADWQAAGGFANPGNGYVSSGFDSINVDPYQTLCYGALTEGQKESYYNNWYLDPGYELTGAPQVAQDFYRYLADVNIWNQLYQSGDYQGIYVSQESDPGWAAGILSSETGLTHYNALRSVNDAESLPPFFHFNWDAATGDAAQGFGLTYAQWADGLEVGIIKVLDANQDLVINELGQPVSAFGTSTAALNAYQLAFFESGELAGFIANP